MVICCQNGKFEEEEEEEGEDEKPLDRSDENEK